MSSSESLVKKCRWIIFILVGVLLLGGLQQPVYALPLTGSLRLNCHVNVDDRSIPLADDTYAIVKIAQITVQEEPAELIYKTMPDFVHFDYDWANLDDKARRQAAGELAEYTQENPALLTQTETTDKNGELLFSPLEPGLYLVVRTQVNVANMACTLDPFLVDIPTAVNGTWEYDLSAVPKVNYQTVEIRPCNVTIYMGGNEGYDGVDGEETTTLPKPMFVIEAPEGVDVSQLTLLYHDDPNVTNQPGKLFEWVPVEIGHDEEGNVCYRLDPKDGTEENFHIQYFTDDGTVLKDFFRPELEEELFKIYKTGIPLDEGEVLVTYVKNSDGIVFYPIQRGTAELTVRGVERNEIVGNAENPVTPVFSQTEKIPKVPAGVGVVTAPTGTAYTLNETDIQVPNIHGNDGQMSVGLLFDDIMNEVYDRQTVLETQANNQMPTLKSGVIRHFQSQYLDLVDMNNGNAWVKASESVQVYWGYPEGTDENTRFTLWHFRGLHRDSTDGSGESGYNLEDILAVEPEKVSVENTPQGIRFTVEPGGFSPFVLVWEETAAENPEVPTGFSLLPQTGDNSPLALWGGALVISLAILIVLCYKKKKQQ